MTVTFVRGPEGFVKHGSKGDPGYPLLHPNGPRAAMLPVTGKPPPRPAVAISPHEPGVGHPPDSAAAAAKIDVNQDLAARVMARVDGDPTLAAWLDEATDNLVGPDRTPEDVSILWRRTVGTDEPQPDDPRMVALRSKVRTYVDTWAASSGDHEPSSIALQRTAAEVFDVDDALTPLRGHAVGGPLDPADYFASGDEEGEAPWEMADDYLAEDGVFLTAFVEEMYAATQADLAGNLDDTHVTVYRGMHWGVADELPAWAVRPPPRDRGWPVHRPVVMQPLSSWSFDRDTARQFSTQGWTGVVLSARVPRGRVFATPRTGAGSLAEREVIVIAGPGEAAISWSAAPLREEIVGDALDAPMTKAAEVIHVDDDWRQADWLRQLAEDVGPDGVTIPANVNVRPPDGPVTFVKHGTKGRPGYRRLHGRGRRSEAREVSATVARRLRQAGQPDLFNQPPDAELPSLPPTTRRGQWAEQAPIPPPPFDTAPTTNQLLDARRRATRKWLKANGRLPTRAEAEAFYAESDAALVVAPPFPKGTEAAIRRAWNDVIGAHPSLARYVKAIRPPSRRMGRGVLGRTLTGFPSEGGPWESDVELRKTMPSGLEDLPNNGGSTPGWDRRRVAEAVATHELAHVLWYKAMRENRVAEGRGSALALSRQRAPDDVPSPTKYGTEDAAEHFAEVFTVTRMFRDPKYRYLTTATKPVLDPRGTHDRFVAGEHERRLEVWDWYVAEVVAGRFPKPGTPPPPPTLRPEYANRPTSWTRKAAMTTELDVHDDDFFGHLTDEQLDAIGLGDWADDDLDDDPVVFVKGPHGFEKARRPWREDLHPRGFGGKFGRGGPPGRSHGVAERVSGLGRRDRPASRPPHAPRRKLGLQEVPGRLLVAEGNDRELFDPAELEQLADSIRRKGILQPPTVRPLPDGTFGIVGGERRIRAMRDVLGWENVPVNVQEMTDEDASEAMLAENTNRKDLSPIEEARGYRKRMDNFGWSIERVAEAGGVKPRRVQERLDLLQLDDPIQDLVSRGQFPVGHARLMRDLDVPRQRIAMQTYNRGGKSGKAGMMTQDQFRELVSGLQADQDQQGMFSMENEDLDARRQAAEAAAAKKKPKDRGLALGAGEIAERFGVKSNVVQQWKSRGHLPPPDGLLSGKIPWWFEATLADWEPPRRGVRKAYRWVRGLTGPAYHEV